jgi:hypothetical protein
VPARARANAITFTGGINPLEMRSGSTITGNVVAVSMADTLTLGGGRCASFDVSQMGSAPNTKALNWRQHLDADRHHHRSDLLFHQRQHPHGERRDGRSTERCAPKLIPYNAKAGRFALQELAPTFRVAQGD